MKGTFHTGEATAGTALWHYEILHSFFFFFQLFIAIAFFFAENTAAVFLHV